MAFTGKEDHKISLEEAKKYVKRYKETKEKEGKKDYKKAAFFGREAIEQLLAQDGAVGIRIYYGQNEKGEDSPVIFAADEKGSNLIDENNILERGLPCPPFCPDNFDC